MRICYLSGTRFVKVRRTMCTDGEFIVEIPERNTWIFCNTFQEANSETIRKINPILFLTLTMRHPF